IIIMLSKLFKILLIAGILLNIRLITAQELDPLVDVDLSKLNVDVRDRLSNFQNDITNYLTRTRFTDEAIVNDVRNKPYKIKCSWAINVFKKLRTLLTLRLLTGQLQGAGGLITPA